MNYMRHKNLGFDKDNIVMVPLPPGGNLAKKELLAQRTQNYFSNKRLVFFHKPSQWRRKHTLGNIDESCGT